jgi:superfamily II DNA or RNA helicase
MARAKSVYGIDKKTFGTITAGKVDIGESITFATVQTMSKLDLSQYRDQWDVIIVDECQHCAGTPTKVSQFYKVMSNLCARHKYGLTATPYRADGLEPAMYALLGDIGFEVSQDEVTSTVPVRVGYVNTGYMPEYSNILQGDGTIDYNKLLEDLITNDKRFDVVSKTIQEKQGKGACMVLANRVAYLERLNSQYFGRSICLSGKGQSKKAKKERAEALEKLNNGQLDCIFATYQLAAEGLDVPNLRYVFFATPEKNQTTVQQSAGRVSRGAEGKEYGTIIDFIDELPMYRAWANKRAAIYKKLS